MHMLLDVLDLGFDYSASDGVGIRNISFKIGEPELFGIIGENGAGKSTLINCIACLLDYTGLIRFGGRELKGLDPKERARNIAVVPQFSPFDLPIEVQNYVLHGRYPFLHPFKKPEGIDHEIVEHAMELVGILDLKDRKIDELSGGMRKKVSIARALTQQPKILLLDEVIANLDIYNRIEIMDLVKKISRDQIVILAIHDLDLAAQYCSELLLKRWGFYSNWRSKQGNH